MNILENFSKYLLGVGIVTVSVLLIPLIAMQFTDEVAWTLSDFLFAAIILSGSGITFGLIAKKKSSLSYRLAVGIAVVTSLLIIWGNGAVGFIGSENNPINLLYGVVLAVEIIGLAISRLKLNGMSNTMFAAAFTQFIIPVIAVFHWKSTGASEMEYWGSAGILQIFAFNGFFVLMFILSGILFSNATKDVDETSTD